MSAVENFLRRWSTINITEENAFLFEEHLFGVQAIATAKEKKLLAGLSKNTSREEFAQRYQSAYNS
jgi:hypothetical protein